MDLFVVRHAATSSGRAGVPKAERALSNRGREDAATLARGLARLGVRLDRLVHSPWRRAVETAEALTLLLDGETFVDADLLRGPSPALLTRLEGRRVAVVGHRPGLGQLVSMLVLGGPDHGERFSIKRGGVVWLRGKAEPGGMTLRAELPPRVLQAL